MSGPSPPPFCLYGDIATDHRIATKRHGEPPILRYSPISLAIGEEGLTFLEIENLELWRPLYLFRRANRSLTPAAQALHDYILNQELTLTPES